MKTGPQMVERTQIRNHIQTPNAIISSPDLWRRGDAWKLNPKFYQDWLELITGYASLPTGVWVLLGPTHGKPAASP